MIKLLYVDDESDLLNLGKIFLEKTGDFQVDLQNSAKDALNHLISHQYDAIISDYQMPVMDGLEFLKQVRILHGQIPFILFTGRGREEVVIQALNLGADFYLQKGGDIKSQFAELSHKILQAIRRKRAEDDLFSSRQMLQLVLDTIPEAVFWKDRNSVYLGCNRPFLLDTGFDEPADIIGKTDLETSSAEIADIFRADDRAVIETGTPKLCYEEPQIKPDGSQAWLRTSKVPLRDQNGDVIGVLGTYQDITEYKKVQDSLQESLERFQEMADLLPQIVFEMDTDFRYTYANKFALEQTGYTADDLKQGLYAFDVIPPYLHDRMQKSLSLVAQNKLTGRSKFQLLRKDGKEFPVMISLSPIIQKGQFVGYRGVAEDLTEYTMVMNELNHSRDYFATIFDNVNDVIVIQDPVTGSILDVNETACRLFKYTKEEFLSAVIEDWEKVGPPYTYNDSMQWIQKARTEGPQSFEWVQRCKDSSLVRLNATIRSVMLGQDERIIVSAHGFTCNPVP